LSVQGKLARNMLAAPALICSVATAAFARDLDLRPGKYAFTVTYEVQGERQNESRTIMRCIRRGDLVDPENVFTDRTSAAKPEEACSVRGLKSAEGRISYDADCSNRTVHVEGELSQAGFSVLRTVRPKTSASVSLKFTVRGKWLGRCGASGTDP